MVVLDFIGINWSLESQCIAMRSVRQHMKFLAQFQISSDIFSDVHLVCIILSSTIYKNILMPKKVSIFQKAPFGVKCLKIRF